ncbi:IS5/IS1182 family transposase, partial [Enterococcus hirae]
FHRFHLRGKQGATIDIGLALMALNLRKLGKYMERKVRKTEKISSILTINIKIELIFFLRKNYCPTLIFFCSAISLVHSFFEDLKVIMLEGW